MAVRLFLGNLAYRISEEELAEAVGGVADVQAVHIPVDRQTGQSRGFGFVEVREDQAELVIKQLTGQHLAGRPMVVHPARPRDESTHRRAGAHQFRRARGH